MTREVISLRQTCSACPSQWEGQLADGDWIYIRYRWGHLSVSVGSTIDEAVGGEELLYVAIGDSFDGVLETSEMKEAVKDVLSFREVKV